MSLRSPPQKGLYVFLNYHDPQVCCDILHLEVDRKLYFDNNYDCMLTKNECELI